MNKTATKKEGSERRRNSGKKAKKRRELDKKIIWFERDGGRKKEKECRGKGVKKGKIRGR